MSLLVLGYPKIKINDFEWIQKIRSAHDARHYKIFDPHFTIIFPVNNFIQAECIDDIIENSSGLKKIIFNLRCAIVIKDSFSLYTDVILVPDEGYSSIVKIHDKLYSGILKNELHLNLPFIPHIAVGGSVDPIESKLIADNLNKSDFSMDGLMDKLDIVNYNYPDLETIKEINLL